MIVPSRGRPENVAELLRVWQRTVTGSSMLLVAVDDDDPELQGYGALAADVWVEFGPRRRVAPTLNHYAMQCASEHFAIGFMGDDHRPRTKGWDRRFAETLYDRGYGVVYGDDLFQHDRLPTAVAVSSNIVQALGYMVPPGLIHMYMDNFWYDLGAQLGCLRYLPDVVIEHIHPLAGKVEWDSGYREANAPSMYAHDQQAYANWAVEESYEALKRVRKAITPVFDPRPGRL